MKFTKENVIKYYIKENHSFQETLKHFNVSQSRFFKQNKEWGISKSKSAHVANIKKTKLKLYGDSGYNNINQIKETNLKRYGVDNQFKREDIFPDIRDKKINKYGSYNNIKKNHKTRIKNSGSLEESYRQQHQTFIETCMEKYGVVNVSKDPEVKERIANTLKDTFQDRYGATCYWTTDNPKRSVGSVDTAPNRKFALSLSNLNIPYVQEFKVENRWFDFKVGNTLIDINPTPTHNTLWTPWNKDKGINENYHIDKTLLANENGFHCVHVFDWDDVDKVVNMFIERDKVFAKNTVVKEITRETSAHFLNTYHLQGYVRDSVCVGLFLGDELISVMSFGKPRYNKNYQYELLRYASSKNVVGGAEKLFKYFLNTFTPKSIISYNDPSKFSGNVYYKLGFNKNRRTIKPSKHWHNMKTGEHFTDNLLRQRGADQLLGTNYGKGTDNEEILILHGFLPVYDVGQETYTYNV